MGERVYRNVSSAATLDLILSRPVALSLLKMYAANWSAAATRMVSRRKPLISVGV